MKASDVVITKINYLHFAALNYVFTTLVIVAISFFTPAADTDTYMGKTFFTRHSLCADDAEEVSDLTWWLGVGGRGGKTFFTTYSLRVDDTEEVGDLTWAGRFSPGTLFLWIMCKKSVI